MKPSSDNIDSVLSATSSQTHRDMTVACCDTDSYKGDTSFSSRSKKV